MTCIVDPNRAEYADILERHLKEVADELRTIDILELINFIQAESFAALEDLLQSSTELFFRDGTLTFAWTARVDVNWETAPIVTLGMEFRSDSVAVFFDLLLGAFDHAARIGGILFEADGADDFMGPAHLCEALARARLPLREASR